MLADSICKTGLLASALTPEQTQPIIKRIANAQKYVLSPQFAAVADALSSDYGSLVRAFPFCRLPYPETWFEFVQNDRPNFAAAELHAPGVQARPDRVGFLCSALRDDLSAWRAHLFWHFRESDIGACAAGLAINYDMINELDTLRSSDVIRAPKLFGKEAEMHPGWARGSESVRLALHNHTHPTAPDYGLSAASLIAPEAVAELARSDWAGEVAYLLAVIGLINARNAVEATPVDYSRLNRARIKRGDKPLFEHHVLKLHDRQVNRNIREGGSGDRAAMRGHFVAGHWKVRQSGVYFWRPFARGDFTKGKITKDYQL